MADEGCDVADDVDGSGFQIRHVGEGGQQLVQARGDTGEVERSDRDLPGGKRQNRQIKRPARKSNLATHEGREQQVHNGQAEADYRQSAQGGAAEPDKALRFGWIEDQPQTAQGHEAETDRQAAEQDDLCDITRIEAPATIETVADGAAGKRCYTDIVPDRQG